MEAEFRRSHWTPDVTALSDLPADYRWSAATRTVPLPGAVVEEVCFCERFSVAAVHAGWCYRFVSLWIILMDWMLPMIEESNCNGTEQFCNFGLLGHFADVHVTSSVRCMMKVVVALSIFVSLCDCCECRRQVPFKGGMMGDHWRAEIRMTFCYSFPRWPIKIVRWLLRWPRQLLLSVRRLLHRCRQWLLFRKHPTPRRLANCSLTWKMVCLHSAVFFSPRHTCAQCDALVCHDHNAQSDMTICNPDMLSAWSQCVQ